MAKAKAQRKKGSLDSLLVENRRYPPPAWWRKNALVRSQSAYPRGEAARLRELAPTGASPAARRARARLARAERVLAVISRRGG